MLAFHFQNRGKTVLSLLLRYSQHRKRLVTTALYRSLGERTVSITGRDGHYGAAMIGQLSSGTRVYLSCKPVDLRKCFDGLSAYVADTATALRRRCASAITS
jgi:hypothetical protein